jgi:hypothetical protein
MLFFNRFDSKSSSGGLLLRRCQVLEGGLHSLIGQIGPQGRCATGDRHYAACKVRYRSSFG